MRVYFLILISTIFFSCNQEQKESTIMKEIDDNKNGHIFLSFFPNMSYDTFEFLKKKETKNNNLIEENSKYTTLHFYQIPFIDKKRDFYIYSDQFGIELSHFYKKYTKHPSRGVSEAGKYEYDKLKNELLKIYYSKYGNYIIKKNIVYDNLDDIEKRMRQNKDFYIFQNDNKVITIDGNFTYNYTFPDGFLGGSQYVTVDENNNILTYSYRINIRYYSTESFKKMREYKVKDSLNYFDRIKKEKEEVNRKKKDQKSKLLEDI